MQVGDLVKYIIPTTFRMNMDVGLGIITKLDGDYYTVLFADCEVTYVTFDELEVVNKKRT